MTRNRIGLIQKKRVADQSALVKISPAERIDRDLFEQQRIEAPVGKDAAEQQIAGRWVFWKSQRTSKQPQPRQRKCSHA